MLSRARHTKSVPHIQEPGVSFPLISFYPVSLDEQYFFCSKQERFYSGNEPKGFLSACFSTTTIGRPTALL